MEVGKLYKVNHSRKGKFNLRVTSFDDTWVTGIIVDSTAKAMLDYNVKTSGDEITVRISHGTFYVV